MPFPFVLVCDLLDECHRLCVANKSNTQAVVDWFARHRGRLDAHDTDLAALLSTLLPEKRTDRVYCIKAPTLEKIIGRALMLGSSRIVELALYKQPGHVEAIDEVLHSLASRIKWSSPCIRNSEAALAPRGRCDLEDLYRRLTAREAKWFTRLVLKDYQPVILDSQLVYRCCDPSLPLILKAQDDFATAIQTLQSAKGSLLPNSTRSSPRRNRILAAAKPKLGVKVGRQNWLKGRSIKHCLDMGHGRMSVEQKIDGEYCQIHVDLAGGKPRVQIFSKSGKDSTEDRHNLHGVIVKSLGFGTSNCSVRKGCILEGELVVHNDVENKTMPFHKIRNHVARRGRLMGTDLDSPPRWYENLMIVYYDILLHDDQSLLGVRHSERFKLLQKTINCERGRAELVKRTLIDFHRTSAASELRKAFANVITGKGEGLVLKPDDPYFNFEAHHGRTSGLCIKLKKEYIGNFGDVGDFAVVGAGFNSARARSYRIPHLQWTVFFVGCLTNKEEVRRWDAKPRFTVVSAVEITEPLLKSFISHCSPVSVPMSKNDRTKLLVPKGIEANAPLTVAFQNPAVFDLRCFSFHKPGNMGFWTLRFPAVSKIHFDRDFSDTVTFDELQEMAENARATPDLEDSQENLEWIARLEGADPRGRAVDAVSQLTATTMPTPSPCSSRTPLPPIMQRSLSEIPQVARIHDKSQKSTAVSTASLFTPPTSSPPEQEPQTPTRESKRKYATPSAPVAEPIPKRRLSTTGCSSPVSATKMSRRPLDDIDGDVSQQLATPRSSLPVSGRTDQRLGFDRMPSHRRGTQKDAASDAACERAGPAEGEPDCTPTGISSPVAAQMTNTSSRFRSRCKFAGDKCHLSACTILLASRALGPSSERTALLDVHGASEFAVSLDDWARENNHGATLGNDKSLQSIILVDTVDKASETKLVLAEVERARKEVPRKTRGWIAVYDWRVLEHLKVMEDEETETKYYDGFHDPWRRWYCGIV
ncbi:ATP dependent DNA ligase domain protein [Metarhizium album ARSEF 1941]|uniref:ATP dependent DNA ligase domain protein n=1 Tax=Metarhizium album (strain ARSEF 1941) TaxID=1081103 RepID=A0A0B2X7J6_METAS|nr:ATP dependent DNA ligase domain protein [Metarhizium album ARSEF 1941]KHO01485.1 ATP dependent DNA ligase domain protein [Metarhizium album ARSEF 1941]